MIFGARWIQWLQQFDRREFYRLMAIVAGALLLFMAIFLYRYYSLSHQLEQRLKQVNVQRKEARLLLEQYEHVIAQQQAVDTLLKEEPGFKIKQFFATVVQGLNLTGHLKQDNETSSHELVDGYIEVELPAQLQGLNMYQILELFYKIEQNKRVYIKESTISKTNNGLLNLDVAIATFEAAELPT